MTNRLAFRPRVRMLLTALAAATALFAVGSMAPASAYAGKGFCEYVKLQPGETCQTGNTFTVLEVLAEVTGTKSGSICVAVHYEQVLYGEKCSNNYVVGGEEHYGHAWVKNNSNTQLTVFGYFNYL